MQSVPVHSGILAVDIENSTSALGANPIKEELRQEVYRRLEASMGVAGIRAAHCGPFADRGDGVLALIYPVDDVLRVMVAGRSGAGCTILLPWPSSGRCRARPGTAQCPPPDPPWQRGIMQARARRIPVTNPSARSLA